MKGKQHGPAFRDDGAAAGGGREAGLGPSPLMSFRRPTGPRSRPLRLPASASDGVGVCLQGETGRRRGEEGVEGEVCVDRGGAAGTDDGATGRLRICLPASSWASRAPRGVFLATHSPAASLLHQRVSSERAIRGNGTTRHHQQKIPAPFRERTPISDRHGHPRDRPRVPARPPPGRAAPARPPRSRQ